MGADGEVVVTHVHDTGLEVKATNSATSSTTDVVDIHIETSGSAALVSALESGLPQKLQQSLKKLPRYVR